MAGLTNFTISELFCNYRQKPTGEVVLDRIIGLLNEHPGLRGNDIAKSLGFKRRDLSSAVLVLMGHNLDVLVSQWHVLAGIEYLQTTDMSFGEISQKCGYTCHKNFAEAFENHFGYTPYEFRKGFKRGSHFSDKELEQSKHDIAELYKKIATPQSDLEAI